MIKVIHKTIGAIGTGLNYQEYSRNCEAYIKVRDSKLARENK